MQAIGIKDVAAAIKAARARPARNPTGGRPGKSEQGSKLEPLPKGNNNRRDLARLARDKPELLDRIEAGELSVNAAAIAAGIRKKPTPEEVCVKAFRKVEDRLSTLKRIMDLLAPHEQAVVRDWLGDDDNGG